MREIFGIVAFLIVIGSTIPYIFDVRAGSAYPALSTSVLFVLLTGTTLYVQASAFQSWVLLQTVAEFLATVMLLLFSFRHGVGGFQRIDKICYVLFSLALGTYFLGSGSAIIGLLLLCLTDFVAYIPTVVKNYMTPHLDTPLYYVAGTVAPLFSFLAASSYTNQEEVLYPLYLFAANLIATIPIVVYHQTSKGRAFNR